MSDTDITDKVRTIALSSLWILPNEVEVIARNGAVTLGGTVADRLTEQILVRMTGEIDGVVEVVSQLIHRMDESGYSQAGSA